MHIQSISSISASTNSLHSVIFVFVCSKNPKQLDKFQLLCACFYILDTFLSQSLGFGDCHFSYRNRLGAGGGIPTSCTKLLLLSESLHMTLYQLTLPHPQ